MARHNHSAGLQCDFQTLRLSDLSGNAEFLKFQKISQALYGNDSVFRSKVNESANQYVDRKLRSQTLAIGAEQAAALSVRYILDEVAFYCVLAESGWCIETYPGSELPVLAEIIKGRIPSAPRILKNRIFIELRKES